jgi:hypothetical protein
MSNGSKKLQLQLFKPAISESFYSDSKNLMSAFRSA